MDFNHTIYDTEEVLSVVNELKNSLDIQDRMWFLKTQRKCFIDAVSWLMKQYKWTEDQAVFFGRLMRTRHIIHHVDSPSVKFSNDGQWWRFQCHEDGPLNWKEIWTKSIDEPPTRLTESLYKQLLLIVQSVFTAPSTNPLEVVKTLKTLRHSRDFNRWEQSTAILQKIQLSMNATEKMSFWLNTYNMLALHSIIQNAFNNIDPCGSVFRRSSFFSKSCYLISGHSFSLDDIEHGILRPANNYFKDHDPRGLFRLSKPDCRIFAVLTCYNKSSPIPMVMPSTGIEKILQFAMQNYFQNHTKIENKTIRLPKLCRWYASDFNFTKTNIVDVLLPILNVDQGNKLERLSPSDITLAYSDYSWELYIDPTKFYGCSS